MISNHHVHRRPLRLAVLGAVLFAASVGVHAADWRRAFVQAVTVASAVDDAVDASCATAHGAGADHRVAIVSYRVGKSSYVRAIPIAADEVYDVREEVLVDPTACAIAHLPKPASQP
jgi:hypothetical protein